MNYTAQQSVVTHAIYITKYYLGWWINTWNFCA